MKKTKIVLAAGIFFPDVGGPAIHVMKIAERLQQEGFDVRVLAYGDYVAKEGEELPFRAVRISRKWPKPLQWFLYMIAVMTESFNAKVVYAFDPTAAGVPASMVATLLRKPFLIRIGGDPIWERIVEKNKRFVTIEEYYQNGYAQIDMPQLYLQIKKVLGRAKAVVVYNQSMKDFYVQYFATPAEKIQIVKNPAFKREDATDMLAEDPVVLFAGRFVSYKNLPLVMRAFSNVRQALGKGQLVLIGDGPEHASLLELKETLPAGAHITFKEKVAQPELFVLIKSSAIAIAPALNEFNPNFVLESLSFGKPALISRGHGLSVPLPEECTFNPKDQNELETKMTALLDAEKYKDVVSKIKAIPMNQSWDDVTDFHLQLIRSVL